jgi:hypothetical protein
MNIEEIKAKLEKYEARQAELAERQAVAKTDYERYDIERMRRIVQTIEWSLISQLRECTVDEYTRPTAPQTTDKEVRA